MEAADEFLEGVQDRALTDQNYWRPDKQLDLKKRYLTLMMSIKSTEHQMFLSYQRIKKHYRIDIVFGQLVGRFHSMKARTKAASHPPFRWWQKLLNHVMAVLFFQQMGLLHL